MPFAEGRQRLGQADRLDRRGGRRIQPLVSQQPGHAGHPALGDLTLGCPQVVIPARRLDPRAIAALVPEPAVRPGHPGCGDLRLRQALEQGVILADGRPAIFGQRRRVPGPADDGDPLAPFPRAARIVCRMCASRRCSRRSSIGRSVVADRGHRLEDRGEQVGAVAAMLDDVLPPAFALAEPGRLGEHLERVDPQAAGQLRGHGFSSPLLFASVSGISSGSADSSGSRPSWCFIGRSMNRTGIRFSSANRIACHSGEKRANG